MMRVDDNLQLMQCIAGSVEFVRKFRYQALFAHEIKGRSQWRDALRSLTAIGHRTETSPGAEVWGYRLLLGREPDSAELIRRPTRTGDTLQVARSIVASREFKASGRHDLLFSRKTGEDGGASASGFSAIRIADLPRNCFADVRASKINGIVRFPNDQKALLPRLRLHYFGAGQPESVSGIELNLGSIPHLQVHIADSHEWITVGKDCQGLWAFRMWGICSAYVGPRTTANGADCYINPGGQLLIGEDCMFADPTIHVGDNHAIFDLETLAATNFRTHPAVVIEHHVWLATRTTVLTESHIGAGSIVGAGSTVKGEVPACALVAGNPGTVVRTGVSWTRSHDAVDAQAVATMLKGIHS
jgi:carbonic anhydrase/acetyltransferase-like protein (isoleucine patch superfamily)